MTIQKLPPELVNQIAAGEVIEGPVAVIKELIENSLDAQASKISIRLEDGGYTRILVQDNGHGIAKDELKMALGTHMTSKLTHQTLDQIASFGFRGEALAALSAVSHVQITSRPAAQDVAYTYDARKIQSPHHREKSAPLLWRPVYLQIRLHALISRSQGAHSKISCDFCLPATLLAICMSIFLFILRIRSFFNPLPARKIVLNQI